MGRAVLADIFISYARDDREKIEKLAAALEGEGYVVWWDRRIEPGSEFSKDIERELNEAKSVIVAWSVTANQSSWVKDEASAAHEQGKLVPIRLGADRPPMGFRQYQALDFHGWKGDIAAPAFQDLARAVKAHVTGEAPAAPVVATKPSWVARLLKPAPLAAFGALIVALIFIFLWQADRITPSFETAATQPPQDEGGESGEATSDQPSIAVLPFDDFSPAGDQEYFADGIAEELSNVLARVEGLRVTSRTSAFAFKGRDVSAGEIAEALKVRHILEGSVRKAGETLRITAQLIDGKTDEHIWSETYDRALTAENIFVIQDEISKAIVAELQGRMDLPNTDSALQTASTEAYDAYLRGRALYVQRTPDTITEGLAQLNRAVALDPDFAPAQAALAQAYLLANNYAGLTAEQAIARATPHAERALALAPDDAESLAAYGWLVEWSGDHDHFAAIDYYKRAIAANPNYAEAWRRLGRSLAALSRFDQAAGAFERAFRLDPLTPIISANWAGALQDQGELNSALAVVRDGVRLNPASVNLHGQLADLLWAGGDYAEAHRLLKDVEAKRGFSNLDYFYDEVGLQDLAAPLAWWFWKAVFALREGDRAEAARLARENPGRAQAGVAILFWAGEIDETYEIIKADIKADDLLSDEVTLTPYKQQRDVLYFLVLNEKKDPDADIFRARLVAIFDGRKPADFQVRESLSAGAMWRMINNDREGALEWLQEMNERGQIWRIMDVNTIYDPIRDTPAFQALIAKREDMAARHRAEIEAQLADPDPDWVTP